MLKFRAINRARESAAAVVNQQQIVYVQVICEEKKGCATQAGRGKSTATPKVHEDRALCRTWVGMRVQLEVDRNHPAEDDRGRAAR
jgi:hypothetical protein